MQECDKECKPALKDKRLLARLKVVSALGMSYVVDIDGGKRVIQASQCSSPVVDNAYPE